MTKPEIKIRRDAQDLARHAAELFVALARDAIARAGRFAVALSGGSTPRALYALLGSPEFHDRIEWARVHLFWSDERCVPPDHPDSNFRMARETLLGVLPIAEKNIHRMRGEREPNEAAALYETEIRAFFGAGHGPRFDLIFLGVGEDGHTASLFPGSGAENETERLVVAVYVERLQSYRLTLTLSLINGAAQVAFLVSGESKSKIVREILAAPVGSRGYPAAKVAPADGKVTWFITRDAASGLPAQ